MPSRRGSERHGPPTRGEWIVFGLKMLLVAAIILVPGVFVAASGKVGEWWGGRETKSIISHLSTTTTTTVATLPPPFNRPRP